MNDIRFFIISGTSGSGKTVALQVLEDVGFYCIDNLPASLLPQMAERAVGSDSSNHKYAVSIDSRNQDFIGDIETDFSSLKILNIDYQIFFVDADDSTLLNRYSETRRKHPLSDKKTSLLEAIHKERRILEHIADIAHHHINTTQTTPHELRTIIRDFAGITPSAAMTLLFESFGFKYGNPADADFLFDVRCLPNPHWDPDLKELTGLDNKVRGYLSSQPKCDDMYQHIRNFIEHWLPSFVAENRNYITVAIGCTGGQHRSVYLSSLLAEHFSASDLVQTQIRHRELP